ncbi:hypothetical protein IRZ71_12145 [Flavobacterium sp. ANB]|uniref:hypothetical protein n=1 Tax=unclassified Flavobacterium TaxID=196869 RepID=UPI0012B7102D|nr:MULTISPECIES: hypothetical protein [unclassified Flavobacterium]MBF4517104.1 hypothetical protein [Flavobacterium sp. ANB]MTD71841.1 hypothetical protein [Flavobacterium sp. LC2016-13]
MKTKLIFYSLFLIGFISIFLPFQKNPVTQNTLSLSAFFENMPLYNLNFSKILQIIATVLIPGPFIFSAILFFYKKYKILTIFNRIPLTIFITLGLISKFENLYIGYYLLLFQQITLFVLLIKIKIENQNKLSQI